MSLNSYKTSKGLITVGDTVYFDFGYGNEYSTPYLHVHRISQSECGELAFLYGLWSDGDQHSHVDVTPQGDTIVRIVSANSQNRYEFMLFDTRKIQDHDSFLNERGSEGWSLASIHNGFFYMQREIKE